MDKHLELTLKFSQAKAPANALRAGESSLEKEKMILRVPT